ncbi:precorrin-6y C5,15-methyltransferase (decarboxylating) subunit CbiE [Rhabdothermincola sediminis]|uniref:precorrin-6y C5,15-methyltransferase (decarboxylating) subunit CbiE n=1 Tax=Rhabdothermincola sediminis TaxID=2751370 RepID=UPI001AA05CA4|nr:precorrin-6y C5,15-methyltransferase (decarboxylating) subunit CbiE [Rhabdothermincola sediminis]
MTGGHLDMVGVIGGEVFGPRAREALREADLLVGAPRHLTHAEQLADAACERVELAGPLDGVLDRIAAALAANRRVCVLASGDPGFFGFARLARRRFGARVAVHPAPSSVSLAWAAAGESWDDAEVISAHGRPLAAAVERAVRSPKAAVLTSPEHPPERLGAALVAAGCRPRRVVVASRLGEPDQQVVRTDLDGLAAGRFDPLSVVLLLADADPPRCGPGWPRVSWGADVGAFEHRDGMITKPEVRAVVLAKLDLGGAGVLWDVGAGSGSVGIEAATVQPQLMVYAIERAEPDAERIRRNAIAHGVAARVEVIQASAPEAFDGLPAPDRIFVGGGGPPVLRAAWDRLEEDGVLTATFTVLEHVLAATSVLDELVQLHVDHAVPIGNAGLRLEPTNPVFVGRARR